MIQELPSCLTRLLLEVLYGLIATLSPVIYSRFNLVRPFLTRTNTVFRIITELFSRLIALTCV